MTNEICGYEGTTTGDPCRHPAGSCPVPSHSDPDAENPAGRPSKYTEDLAEDAIQAARLGKSKAGCARAAGVGEATLQRWLDEHEEFRSGFRRARSRGETGLIEGGLRDDEVDTSMAKFLLASSFGYKKSEKREVEMDADVSHSLEEGFEFEFPEEDDT